MKRGLALTVSSFIIFLGHITCAEVGTFDFSISFGQLPEIISCVILLIYGICSIFKSPISSQMFMYFALGLSIPNYFKGWLNVTSMDLFRYDAEITWKLIFSTLILLLLFSTVLKESVIKMKVQQE